MNRLRRLDERFERGVERVLPSRWGRGRSPWDGLVGVAVAYVLVGAVLSVVMLLTDSNATVPLVNLALGLVGLPLGIRLRLRWLNRHRR